ncbi:MAG: hypothetical protein ACFBSE_13070, partial [Prochloraceae cyanobacterium]
LLFTEGIKQSRGNTSTLNTPALPPPAPQNINTTQANTDDVSVIWPDRDLVTSRRIYNKPEKPPFVDDIYRADNRYGPKPKYTDIIDYPLNNAKTDYIRRSGNEIQANDYLGDSSTDNDNFPNRLTNIDVSQREFGDFGFDGYWERRAWGEGLRIIVGQRLELGNAYGWGSSTDTDTTTGEPDTSKFAEQDPLYPPYAATQTLGNGNPEACKFYSTGLNSSSNNINNNRCHERRQWKTLRDNLAAVQATAVYTNYKDDSDVTKREFPVACLATTVHPGTRQTLDDSTIFNYYPGSSSVIDTNFLQGKGTNGWEFNPPGDFTTEAQFAAEINNKNSALWKALKNLAYFAGDPDGAFPAKQDNGSSANAITHPYPYTMMWGDFSNLRRAIDILDGNYTDSRPDGTTISPTYTYKTVSATGSNTNDLSLADKTTLQTAACTLGMLAYNLDNIENNQDLIQKVSDELAAKFDRTATPTGVKPIPSDDNNSDGAVAEYKTAIGEDSVKRIELIEQVSRDRLLGFKNSNSSVISPERQNYIITNVSDFEYGNKVYDPLGDPTGSTGKFSQLQNLGFDFSEETGNNYFGIGVPNTAAKEEKFIRLALLLRDIIDDTTKDDADEVSKPKYPSLFYIFPKVTHDEDGLVSGTNTAFGTNGATYKDNQNVQFDGSVLNEEYVVNMKLSKVDYIRQDGASEYEYIPINTNVNDYSGVEITPREPDSTASNPWIFQCSVSGASPQIGCTNDSRLGSKIGNKIILPDNTPNDPTDNPSAYVALLDKGIFNGREQMSVRSLDLDLDLLRHNRASDMTENWLPDTGIVYAFREDTMREDGIERPRQATFANCNTLEKITNVNLSASGTSGTPNCIMDAVGSSTEITAGTARQQDPPLEDEKFISPKPIDIYADPDRRPYGFRLRNGRDLRRCHADFGNGTGESFLEGLSFITDSPTYIQADDKGFNLHVARDTDCDNSSYADSNRIEEFNTKLQTNFSNFYSRGTSGADGRFAREGDVWRPSTILADSVSILSNKFFDGSIADGLLVPRYTNTNRSIYENDTYSGNRNYPYPQSAFNSSGTLKQPLPDCTTSSDRCSSYFNLKYPRWISNNENNDNLPKLLREDGSTSNAGNRINAVAEESPIKISRNGYPIYEDGTLKEFGNESSGRSNNFRSFTDNNKLIEADSGSRVNAIIISGLIPSRANQGYGGLHNFPRFNERWGVDLFISGSLLQLNFSTSGTAPFDQDSWEPSHRPGGSEYIRYYSPPNRRWGYDVGLQLAPAGPVEERFVTNSSNVSEFYRQLPVDDPYITNLRCGTDTNGNIIVDPSVDPNDCP